ncbi:MAG: hypothetical protein ACYCY2_02305 [Acidithiobacillus ferriphilus]
MKSSRKKKLAPYAKALIARRIAEDVPGLVVVATGFDQGLRWAANHRVSRLIVPMDSDPQDYEWTLPLIDLDVLVATSGIEPDSWLTRLVSALWTGEPRMIWLQDEDKAWMLENPITNMKYELWRRYPSRPATLDGLAKAIREQEIDAAHAERGARMDGDNEWTQDQWFR